MEEMVVLDDPKYPPKGRINDLRGYLSEDGAGARFRTGFGSFDDYYIRYNWQDVLGGCSDYGISYPDPPSKFFKPTWLSDHGLRLSMQTFGGTENPFDIFYNETFRQELISDYLEEFESIVWHDLVDELILGDEAPATLFEWFGFEGDEWPDRITKYDATLFAETGVHMPPSQDNLTEKWIFENWLANRTMSVMNYIYDGFKSAYPDLSIAWGTMPWGASYEPTLLKSDFINGGYYTDDFRKFYAMIRHAILINPEAPVISVIMGDDDPDNPLGMPLTVQEQFFWTAYFAGGTKVGWFDAGNNQHWTTIGDEQDFERYKFHCELNRLANTLPIINVTPIVLDICAIRGGDVFPAVGFREFDSATQFQVMDDGFSLDQYSIVTLDNQYLLCDTVTRKLSDYVNGGGNLILKGNLQVVNESLNTSGHSRTLLLPLEEGTSLIKKGKDDSQLLKLQDDLFGISVPDLAVKSRVSINFTESENWDIITTGISEEAQGYWPIALYHNDSIPDSGHILYYGFDSNLDDDLYIPLVHNFVNNFLEITDVASPEAHPDWLISTGIDDNDRIIIGIIPDATEGIINVPINITRRGLPLIKSWMYRGFSSEVWLGDVSRSEGSSSFRTSVSASEPQRWVLAPEFPAPNLQVHAYYPKASPYVNETIPISIEVLETLEHVNIDNFKVQLKLPSGLTLANGSQPVVQSVFRLSSMEKYYFYWLVNASSPQLYEIGITISAPSFSTELHYSMSFRVFPGRLEIKFPSKFYFTLNDSIILGGSLKYYGTEPRNFSISDCIQNYVWGNPGGFLGNVTLYSTDTYEISYKTNPIGHRVGEIAEYYILAVDPEGMIWAEEYFQVEILPAMLRSSNLAYSGGKISIDIDCVGTDYITNIVASVRSDEITVENSIQYLGTLAPGTMVSPSWKITRVNYPVSLEIIITADELPYSIKKTITLFSDSASQSVFVFGIFGTIAGIAITSIVVFALFNFLKWGKGGGDESL